MSTIATIEWVRPFPGEGVYLYEQDNIRASHGGNVLGTVYGWWAANDLRNKDCEFLHGVACDTLTARIAAEEAIRELQRKRME